MVNPELFIVWSISVPGVVVFELNPERFADVVVHVQIKEALLTDEVSVIFVEPLLQMDFTSGDVVRSATGKTRTKKWVSGAEHVPWVATR